MLLYYKLRLLTQIFGPDKFCCMYNVYNILYNVATKLDSAVVIGDGYILQKTSIFIKCIVWETRQAHSVIIKFYTFRENH